MEALKRIKSLRKAEKKKERGLTSEGPLQKPGFLTKNRCIGGLIMGKCLCNKDLTREQEWPAPIGWSVAILSL